MDNRRASTSVSKLRDRIEKEREEKEKDADSRWAGN
jgi:hypothetical protein